MADWEFGQIGAQQVEILQPTKLSDLRLHDAMLVMDPSCELLTARFVRKTRCACWRRELNASVPTVQPAASRAPCGSWPRRWASMGVPAADERLFRSLRRLREAAGGIGGQTLSDHGGLRFAPDWRSAELTPFGAIRAAATQTLIPGFSRPLRVGALVSYDSSLIVGANRKPMNVWQQVYSTTVLPQAGVRRIAVVEPGTVHRGIVECTLRDHGIIGGLMKPTT